MDAKARKRPCQARSIATVDAILDGAARILAREGRDAANTNAIAVAAGVSIGSLYQYFPNREAVLRAVVDRHGERIYAMVAECLDERSPRSLEEAVRSIVDAVFKAHRLDPHLHGALDDDFKAAHAEGYPTTKTAVLHLIAALPEPLRREIRPCSPMIPVVVAEMIHSLAHVAFVHPTARVEASSIERQAALAVIAYLRSDGAEA